MLSVTTGVATPELSVVAALKFVSEFSNVTVCRLQVYFEADFQYPRFKPRAVEILLLLLESESVTKSTSCSYNAFCL